MLLVNQEQKIPFFIPSTTQTAATILPVLSNASDEFVTTAKELYVP